MSRRERTSDRREARAGYVNAKDVLPEELLRQVQRYCSGNIYVPASREFYRRRRRDIVRLARQGVCGRAIAEEVHICERRVWQILAEARGEE